MNRFAFNHSSAWGRRACAVFLSAAFSMLLAQAVEPVEIKIKDAAGNDRDFYYTGESANFEAIPKCDSQVAQLSSATYTWSAMPAISGVTGGGASFGPITLGTANEYTVQVDVTGVLTNGDPYTGRGTKTLKVLKLDLDELSFKDGHGIYHDTGSPPALYDAPHWQKSRAAADQHPYLYVRNVHPKIGAKFKVTPSSFNGKVKVRGKTTFSVAGITYSFTYAAAEVNFASGSTGTYPDTSTQGGSGGELPAKVAYLPSFKTTWQASCDGGTVYKNITSASDNKVYLTLATPSNPARLFRTLVHLACSTGNAGAPNPAVANIWSQLTPKNFKTWDNRALYYYKPGIGFNICTDTAGLLDSGNGQCGAWADLFQDALKAHNITSTWFEVVPGVDPRFMVKNWTFGSQSFPGVDPHHWKLRFETTAIDMVPVPTGSIYGDLTSLATLGGQNSAPPSEKVFTRHFIVKYGGRWYDPSYGVTYTGPNDFEHDSVDGYLIERTTDNPAGFTQRVLRAKKSTTPAGAGLHEIQFNPPPGP